MCGILISLCQHLYLPQISGFGAKAAEIPWQMRRNRWPVAVPFSWGKEGLVWVEVWVGGQGPSLSVGATVAGQAPPQALEVHLQSGKFEVRRFKVFVPTIIGGHTVGDLAPARR